MPELNHKKITINDIDAFVFDFDGVLTNNLVHINQDGKEWVTCNRGDGLAFDLLRKLKKPAHILSTEKNHVVTSRANKLKIHAIQGVSNKVDALYELVKKEKYELKKLFYVGNDLNDYRVMLQCGYTACPSDSHVAIKNIVTYPLKTKGGDGVVREILEMILDLNFIQILYPE